MCRTISCTRFSRNCLWNREFDCWRCMRAYRCLLFTTVTSNNKKKIFSPPLDWLSVEWVRAQELMILINSSHEFIILIYYDWLLKWLLISSSSDLNISSPMYGRHRKKIMLAKPANRLPCFSFLATCFLQFDVCSFELLRKLAMVHSNYTTTEDRLCFQIKK